MDDSPVPNSQYALQLALQTMKERCIQLQKRVATLQEENMALKEHTPHDNISHNSLEIKVFKLTEERNQLKNTITMVAAENKQLWTSLSRLTNEKSLGHKISQISDTLNPNCDKAHVPLIRSRTFTQEAPHTRHLQKVLSENDKVSLELEDISLKLQQSDELDMEMQEFELTSIRQHECLPSLGFNYLEDEEIDDSLSDCIEQQLHDLKNIKLLLQQHHDLLQTSVDNLKTHKLDVENNKLQVEKRKLERSATKTIQVNIEDEEREASKLSEQQDWGTPDSSLKLDKDMDKICPMCSKKFHFEVAFDAFSRHVEEHFMENDVLRL